MMERQATDFPPAPSGHSQLQEISLGPSTSHINGTNGANASFEVESGSFNDDKRGLFAGSESSYSYSGPTRHSRSHRPRAAQPPSDTPANPHDAEPVAKWYHRCCDGDAMYLLDNIVNVSLTAHFTPSRRLLVLACSDSHTGEISLAIACIVSYYTSYQLAVLHHYEGARHNRYRDLGRAVFGPRLGLWLVVPFQVSVMVGLGITYTVTAGQSLKALSQDVCFYEQSQCDQGLTGWIFIFGGLQLFLSQLPNFHGLWWVSMLGAATSCIYTSIAAFASAAYIGQPSEPYSGSANPSTADTVFSIFSSLGGITFSLGGHSVLLEIQATLAEPPRAMVAMMYGISAAYVVVVFGYFLVASLGFGAFGIGVAPNVLLSIPGPRWVIDIANLCVFIHVSAGYQVFSMPLFEAWEGYMIKRRWRITNTPWLLRFLFRSMYVIFTTIMAATFPFFEDLMGLIGAIGFLPMTFIIPAVMWLIARRTSMVEKCWNLLIIVVFTIVALLSFVGAMRNIIVDASTYTFWS